MRILAFDTSTPVLSLGIYDDGKPLWERRDASFGGHAEQLAPLIELALQSDSMRGKRLDRIAVGTGPGSFTGLRVGVMTASALGYALRLEVIGVCTLEAVAATRASGVARYPVSVAADARRGMAYVLTLNKPIGVSPPPSPVLLSLEECRARASAHGLMWLGGPGPGWESLEGYRVDAGALASGVAAVAALRRPARGAVHPMYVRPKDCNVTLGGSGRRTFASAGGRA